jgi:hypothetical protein
VTLHLFTVRLSSLVLLASLIAIGAWLYVRLQRGRP